MKKYISPDFITSYLESKNILIALTLFSDNDIPVDEEDEETEET